MNRLVRRRALLFAFCASAPVFPVSAQQPPQLTLSEAITRGLQSDPGLDLAAAAYARARSNAREAGAARQPTLSVDANVTRFKEPMLVFPLHRVDPADPPRFDPTLLQASSTVGYTVFDASRGGRIDRAEALVAAAQVGERAARMQLLSDVARLFLQLRAARELSLAAVSRVQALDRERARAAQLVEQGKAARVVLLRAQAALSAAQAESVNAVNYEEMATNELARQLGMSADSLRKTALRGVRWRTPALLNPAAYRAVAQDSSPELERARSELVAAEAGRSEARGLRLPRLHVGGRIIEYGSADNGSQAEWQGALQLSYPVFTGGARAAANDRAAAEVNGARAEYELARRRVDDAVDRAVAAVNAARARLAALEATVEQSEEVTRIDRLALEAGAGVQTDYLTAEADLFRARASLTDARATELIALIELARVSGQLSEQWLMQNVESNQ